ncbi:MAG TPA: SMP-30/gluconolactonase/LRE family protein [Ferrovibrio sp.]|uniref:SMP-30/gluconolactonase/LRE family protein n=1 Tax=Ferrovibrio sp. TaxID=1917215 RepID=UPI002ED5D8EF
MTDATCILDGKFDLAESPVWSVAEQKLWFVDINAPAIQRFDPATGKLERWTLPESIGCMVRTKDGGIIGALRSGLYRLDLTSGRHQKIAAAPYTSPDIRFNDGRCDRRGRFWVGGMFEPGGQAGAAFYRLDGERFIRQDLVGGVATSNALAWSPDGSVMYHADTPTRRVFAYDFDMKAGTISNRRLFLDLNETGERPDGATVDSAGNYWVAFYGAGKVAQFSPTGRRLRDIHLPVKAPTMPCFGGPDLKTLYITTARQKHTEEELQRMPLAGGLFKAEVDIPGLPEPFFAG